MKDPTVYKIGDALFEVTLERDEGYHVRSVVREWAILSVVDDPLYKDTDGRVMQVVTMRAFTKTRALYMAEIAAYVDISINHGTWRRTRAEAEALSGRGGS